MSSEGFGVFAFIILVVGLVYFDYNGEVDVTICENGGLTTYVGRVEPSGKLNFGECRTDNMIRGKYYELRQMMKSSK